MAHKKTTTKQGNRASRKFLLLALASVVVLTVAVIFAVAGAAREVTILDGSKSVRVMTSEKDPQKIIEENGFALGEYDVLDSSQFEKENAVLIIKREMTVTFSESGAQMWKVTLPARTAGDVLAYLGIELEEGDEVVPASFDIIKQGDVVTLYRAGEATLSVDGVSTTVVTGNKTVKQILAENHIQLGKDDLVSPALEVIAQDGDQITVVRVVYKTVKETQEIAYQTVTESDSSLPKGEEKLVREGKPGEKEVTYKVRYEGGKAVKKKKLSEKVITEATDEVYAVGTAKAAEMISAQGSSIKYKAKYTGIASAYYEPAGNLTASGLPVGVGRIGVNPNIIPYGTKLYVTGYGYCVAADCGWGTIGMGRVADVYFASEAECEAWGLREVTVYVLA